VVPAAEAADEIPAARIIAQRIVAKDRRRDQWTVHALIARIGRQAVLSRHGEYRTVPWMGGVGTAGRDPRLLDNGRLASERINRRLICILQIAHLPGASARGVANGKRITGAIGDLGQRDARFLKPADAEGATYLRRHAIPSHGQGAVGAFAKGI